MADVHDLDYVDRPSWYAGPPPKVTAGPVIEAYIDTEALDHDCPDCSAGQGEFCRHPLGHERKMPCGGRIKVAARNEKGCQ